MTNLPLSSPGKNTSKELVNKPLASAESSLSKSAPKPQGEAAPLAPQSFKNPKSKKGGNRKVIAVILGSLVVLFLIGAIGVVTFRLFSGDGEDDLEPRNDTDSRGQRMDTTESEDNVDLGVWTTVPPCLDLKDPAVWIRDPDNDGLTNAEERMFGTDPCERDTSGDGVSDGDAVRAGQNPLGPGRLDFAKYGLPDPESN